jgi:hypothetical protein
MLFVCVSPMKFRPTKRSTGRKKALITSTIAAAVIAAFAMAAITYNNNSQQQAQGQNESLGQIASSVTPIYPQVTAVNGSLNSVNGTSLAQLASSSTSESIKRTNGTSIPITNNGQAAISLKHAVASDGQDIIAVTVTNTDSAKFYLTGLLFKGGASIPGTGAVGIENVEAYVIDRDYSPQVWGSIQKPAITHTVPLNPGESFSAYIKGKWLASPTNQPVDTFSVGARYEYNPSATAYELGNAWSISVDHFKLP